MAIAAVLLAATLARSAAASEPVAVTGAGILPIDAETKLVVTGLAGRVIFQASADKNLRVVSVDARDPNAPRPVGIWVDGDTVTVRAPADTLEQARQVNLDVPAGMAVSVHADGLGVQAARLSGGLDVAGARLDVNVQGMASSAVLNVKDSAVSILGVDGDVTLHGGGVKGEVNAVAGTTSLVLTGSIIAVKGASGSLDADLTDTAVETESVQRSVRLRLRGGTATLRGMAGGGTIDAQGTPITIASAEGTYDVDTDREIRIEDTKASLHVVSHGGGVRGSNVAGTLSVDSDEGPVALADVSAGLRVRGDGLDVTIEGLRGETTLDTRFSKIGLSQVSAAVKIDDDGGDVAIDGMSGKLTLSSRDGSVRVTQLQGAATIEADGPSVAVGWQSMPKGGDSSVVNPGGDVTVSLGGSTACRVDAQSQAGTVTSSVRGVVASGDGTSAQGRVRGGLQPLLTVRAGGNIKIGQ